MSAGLDIGQPHALRSSVENSYLKNGDPGLMGGGTITGTNTQPTLEMYENIFGPAGRDVKIDNQRHKRHQRWHLPDVLRGHNQYLTDRIDGLITDATNSPFTRNILPYVYLENPDQKMKWNVYSFDEGIASRVPYEAAARVLPQTKRSFAGYTVRQGLAIAMEHNFMASSAGQQNFKNQLTQLVGSIQLTNDLDVHVALLQAPSYQKFMNERYHDQHRTTAQICREYVDLFGILQKTTNALDILIEDAKNTMKTWGSQNPTFLLCNGALTTQLTMNPEATNYLTNGPDGKQNLKRGPDLPSYRGLNIINSRKFSMDAGTAPRDLLRRRVRVAEYYHIVWNQGIENREYEFYDQSRDTMFRLSYNQLLEMSTMNNPHKQDIEDIVTHSNEFWHASSASDDTYKWYFDAASPNTYPFLEFGGLLQSEKTAVGGSGTPVFTPEDKGGMIIPGAVRSKNNSMSLSHIRKDCIASHEMNGLIETRGIVPKEVEYRHYDDLTELMGCGIFRDAITTSLVDEIFRSNLNVEKYQKKMIHRFGNLSKKDFDRSQFTDNDIHNLIGHIMYVCTRVSGSIPDGNAEMKSAFENEAISHLCTGNMTKLPLKSARDNIFNNANPDYNRYVDNDLCRNYASVLDKWLIHIYDKWMAKGVTDWTLLKDLLTEYHDMKQTILFYLVMNEDAVMDLISFGGYDSVCRNTADVLKQQDAGMYSKLQTNIWMALHYYNKNDSKVGKLALNFPMPNFHLKTCNPLTADDIEHSASSLHPQSWMIQQVAGMFTLQEDTCNILLKQTTLPAPDQERFKKFLMPEQPVGQCDDSLFQSFLMCLFMSLFHPSEQIRNSAKHLCRVGQVEKKTLCDAVARSIRQNRYDTDALNKALRRLVPSNFSTDKGVVCGVASADKEVQTFRTRYYDRNDMPQHAKTFTKIPWDQVVVANNKSQHIFEHPNNVGHAVHLQLSMVSGDRNITTLHEHEVLTKISDPLNYSQMRNTEDWGTAQMWKYDEDTKSNKKIEDPKLHFRAAIMDPWLLSNGLEYMHQYRMPCNLCENTDGDIPVRVYDESDAGLQEAAAEIARVLENADDEMIDCTFKHIILVLVSRFFEHGTRFMGNGKGIGLSIVTAATLDQNPVSYMRNGLHFMHGPFLPSISNKDSCCGNKDLVILRPNIEHEMLGVIMGRGGTQELGATFWGQTELSCYDDAQHGVWGMSYKYHERAMVTNERNLIRVFDVAFDGYNGGMDQECVDWNDPDSIRKFSQATYSRDRPYTGPSMLVMALPHDPKTVRCNWPNPIVFHDNMSNNPTPDPMKDNLLPTVDDLMVFSSVKNPKMCTPAQEQVYKQYMNALGMHQWSSLDASSRPAGENCIANEASTQMLAFQGTMIVYDKNGNTLEHIQGSGHLGPSYVGVASIREGRGIQNTKMQPQMIRQI